MADGKTQMPDADGSGDRSAAVLRAICDASTEGVVLHRENVVVMVNGPGAAMMGYTPEEMIGRSILDFVAPSSRPAVLHQSEQAGDGTYFATGQRRDGTAIQFEVRARNIQLEDGVLRAAVLLDISERDRAERERAVTISLLRATIDSVGDAVLVVDKAGVITLYNERFREMWGIPSELIATNADELAIAHAEAQLLSPRTFRARIEALYATPEEESVDTIEFRDGRLVDRHSRPQRIGDQIVGRVWTFRDVTAQRRAERTLELAVQMRDEFLGIASHELFTPITSLGVAIHGLRSMDCRIDGQPIPEAQRERLFTNAERQVRRLTRLVEQLLDVTRIDGGRLALLVAEVDLCAVAREAIERFGPELERDGIAARVDAPAAVLGRWDVTRLHQVLDNLLANAMKFGCGRPIDIVVRGGPEHAQLAVRDHGLGIPIDQQTLIFERFQRAVSSRHFAGLGLGLFITRQIVEAHGGVLRLESSVGEGSTFTVELPTSTPSHALPEEASG